ncbi:TonB-dependent receptor [Sinomicrobium soli]|uniref:TonB-dependent receptor n=1 Tax=Sinomicrobium sp. N-1-3-6 TaxID=2219864 RepID=UPI000DCDCEFF|nr:TonB-dependent receptor [Sinomicrobium sp. N-1-3-6]RAV28956.1 TonB-dependent receptor [Sinomicrobium sp. N-1-3-6]
MRKIFTLIYAILFAGLSVSFGQQYIEGKVVDAGDGQPLPGATIKVRGSTEGTTTDFNGVFSLKFTGNYPLRLQFSYLGYQSRELTVSREEFLSVGLSPSSAFLAEVVVSARRRDETALEVPIPVSVVGGGKIEETGAFNVNRVKELVPTVQLYSSNPRNTTLNIRGLGSTFGLTNDGIDPGVGFYVDGVYYARPAVTTLDFIDIDRIEVLRGPQGTLFGKNTTAGAFNITTRKASFDPSSSFETSFGKYGFVQAKSSVTGGLIADKLAGRISFSGTHRNGTIYNVARDEHVNTLNNIGFRGQLLFTPNEDIDITLIGDISSQKPNGYAQVFAGVVRTQRPEFRQFDQIIADLDYELPGRNPFDRVIDHDTPWRSLNQLGGLSVNADFHFAGGTLTSTTAWRYWNWGPSNDRDFTGLPVLNLSQAPSRHDQWSQEIRYAGEISSRLSAVLGVFVLWQDLKSDPVHTQESGAAQWRFAQNTQDPLWQTPGLLEGYGIKTTNRLKSFSGAVFANIDWEVSEVFHVLPGIRFNYDTKDVDYKRETYGGLETDDPDLLALKDRVYSDQQFTTDVNNTNFSGQLTLKYQPVSSFNAYGTFSTAYKPIGVNLGGLPTENGEPLLDLAEVEPEYVTHFEVGFKSKPAPNASLNFTAYNTSIKDFQTVVQTPELGVNRGYLSNADKVRVRGAELEGNVYFGEHFSFFGAAAYTEGKYVKFENAPVPLEEVGGEQAFKDVSGGRLPGISRWAGSLGGELTSASVDFWRQNGTFFFGFDSFFRSGFSSSPSPSRYLNVPGYGIFNARAGFRAVEGLSVFVWGRNILDKDYYEQLLPAGGSAGHYAAVLGDPVTYGVTLKYEFR